MNNYQLSQCKFSKFLSQVISVQSDSEIITQTITSRLSYESQNRTALSIEGCTFTDIKADEKGGCISFFMPSHSKSKLTINGCSFTNCYSSQNSAVFEIATDNTFIKNTCFSLCSTPKQNQVGHFAKLDDFRPQEPPIATFATSSWTHCPNPKVFPNMDTLENTIYFDIIFHEISDTNISHNSNKFMGSAVTIGKSPYFGYDHLLISNNCENSVITIDVSRGELNHFYGLVFYNNSLKNPKDLLVNFGDVSVNVKSTVFYQNTNNIMNGQKVQIMIECDSIFGDTEVELGPHDPKKCFLIKPTSVALQKYLDDFPKEYCKYVKEEANKDEDDVVTDDDGEKDNTAPSGDYVKGNALTPYLKVAIVVLGILIVYDFGKSIGGCLKDTISEYHMSRVGLSTFKDNERLMAETIK